MLEGVQRHIEVWREAWKAETEAKKTKRDLKEKQFLPAALEILETPPSPVGRTLVWLLAAFFVIAIGWSVIGRVDVVAVAQGRLVPLDKVKLIQAAEMGVVKAIHVRDGMRVKAGDVLIELDSTYAGADEDQARRSLQIASVAKASATVLADFINGTTTAFIPPEGTSDSVARTQERLITSRRRAYEAQVASLSQQRAERRADLAVVTAEINKLNETLPLIDEQVAAREELMKKGLSPRLLFLELKERQIDHRRNIEIQMEQRNKVRASILTVDREMDRVQEEFRKTVIAEFAEAEDQISLATAELNKATRRFGLQQLTSPVDGTVQQLVVNTLGGVVQPAEPLMVIVPGDGQLVVEAQVLNKDIGFVKLGDKVEVKLEAFPFTKYGVIHGTLENLSLDAIQDEHLGLVYAARITIEKDWIKVNERTVNLTPGMALAAEIKTDKRRLIEFILSPLLRYRDEALRER